MTRSRLALLVVLACALCDAPVQAQAPDQQAPAAPQAAPAPDPSAAPEPAAAALPAEHAPYVTIEMTPKTGVATGDVIKVSISADAVQGDDVTVPAQSFAPFEVQKKRVRVEPAQNGRQRFVFDIELLAFDPGEQSVAPIELRVVTKDGFVGSIKTPPQPLKVSALLGNEPDAKLKPESKPVVVMQDDYRLLYALGGLLGAALVALITWLTLRYLQRRKQLAKPPPPPRPPWEIAIEKLGRLRKRKQQMVDDGKAAQFVDEVSDVVREYLGGRYGFEGLESTTDEILLLLRSRGANVGLWQEIAAYLRRCDLVKFAKVEPDQDEADLVFTKAQDIVQFSVPTAPVAASAQAPDQRGAP